MQQHITKRAAHADTEQHSTFSRNDSSWRFPDSVEYEQRTGWDVLLGFLVPSLSVVFRLVCISVRRPHELALSLSVYLWFFVVCISRIFRKRIQSNSQSRARSLVTHAFQTQTVQSQSANQRSATRGDSNWIDVNLVCRNFAIKCIIRSCAFLNQPQKRKRFLKVPPNKKHKYLFDQFSVAV